MNKRQQLWKSLGDKEYREKFVADIGTGLAFQIRLLREKFGWTQEELAVRTGRRQATISQWENPDYGSYTLKSLKDLAAAFDVALLVKFAPFSELVDSMITLTPERLAPPSFDEELHQRESATLALFASRPSIVNTADSWEYPETSPDPLFYVRQGLGKPIETMKELVNATA